MENNSYQFANAFRSFSVKAGAEHVYPLFDRSASLSFASEEYRNIGIGAIVSGEPEESTGFLKRRPC